MECKQEVDESGAVIKISGPLTIEHVQELHTILYANMNRHDTAAIDLRKIDAIDLAGIQLLCSAKMSYEKVGKSIFRQGKSADCIEGVLKEIGYTNDGECSGRPCRLCFWKKERR